MRRALFVVIAVALVGCTRGGCSRPREEAPPPALDDARSALAEFREEMTRARSPEERLALARTIVEVASIEAATFAATGDVYRHHIQPEPPESCLTAGTCFHDNLTFIHLAQRAQYGSTAAQDADARARTLAAILNVPSLEAALDRRARFVAERLQSIPAIAYRGAADAPQTVYLVKTGHACETRRDAAVERVLATHPGRVRFGVIARADASAVLAPLGDRLTAVAVIGGELRLDVIDEEQWLEQLFPGEPFPPSKPRPFDLALIDGHSHVADHGHDRMRAIALDERLAGGVVAALPGPTTEKIVRANDEVFGFPPGDAPFFWPLGTLDDLALDAPSQLQALLTRGAHGVKLLTGHDDFHRARNRPVLDPPPLREVLRELEAKGRPLLWHVNTHLYGYGFLRVLDDFPRLVVVNPHLGGYLGYAPQLLRKLLTRYPNLHVDLSFGTRPEYLRRSFEDLSARRDEWRQLMIDMPDRFLYGIDMVVTPGTSRAHARMLHRLTRAILEEESFDFDYFPARGFSTLRDTSHHHAGMRGLSLPREVLEKIYNGNARRIYALQ